MKMTRTRLFNMRMNDEEWARLQQIANYYDEDYSGVLRLLLTREARALGRRKGRALRTKSKPKAK